MLPSGIGDFVCEIQSAPSTLLTPYATMLKFPDHEGSICVALSGLSESASMRRSKRLIGSGQTELTASAMLAPHKGFQPIRPHSRPIPGFSRPARLLSLQLLTQGI